MASRHKPERIGILTGGGDCPGLNAVIRAVTKGALHEGIEVVGIADGFAGLIENRTRRLEYDDVSNILTTGGTILGCSNEADPTSYRTGTDASGKPVYQNVVGRCLKHATDLGIELLVTIGGDGTQTIAHYLAGDGLPCIGVPKTIDNDVVGTDITFGFLTAAAIGSEALDRVHTTAASHHRVLLVEVMGRHAGWLALQAGLASGADVILIPEIPFSYESICEAIEGRIRHGKRYTVMAVAEGARPRDGEPVFQQANGGRSQQRRLGGISQVVAAEVERRTGIEARAVILGHVQRGGTPAAADRVLATVLGSHAVDLAKRGERDRMVVVSSGALGDVPLALAAGVTRTVPPDSPLLAAARTVFTGFGE